MMKLNLENSRRKCYLMHIYLSYQNTVDILLDIYGFQKLFIVVDLFR